MVDNRKFGNEEDMLQRNSDKDNVISLGNEPRSARVSEKYLDSENITLGVGEETKENRILRDKTILISKNTLAVVARLFLSTEKLPSILNIIDNETMKNEGRADYDKILRKCCKIMLKKRQYFNIPRENSFWYSQIILPLLNKSSLHGFISGHTKLGSQYSLLTRQSETRDLFTNGIFPDLCDGWLFKLAMNKNNKNSDDYLLQTPLGETIYLSEIPSLNNDCGDENILLLDFFVEISSRGGRADRTKLHLQMGQAVRIFADLNREYPTIFGLTFDAEIVNGYTVHVNNSSSVASTLNDTVSSMQSEDEERTAHVPSVSINHLWTLNLNDSTDSLLLASCLARINELRLQQFKKWRNSVDNLPFKKPPHKQAQMINNTKETKDDNDGVSNDNYDDEDDGSNVDDDKNDKISTAPKEFISLLSEYGFMPRDNSNLSVGTALVYRGWLIDDGTPVVFKGFDNLDQFSAELRIYEHLTNCHFKHMPKMLKYQCSNDLDFIITEDLGKDKLKLETKEDIKMFAFDLLKAVEALHDFRVIHSDLKLSNLHYSKKERMVKLFDFSFSSIFKRLWPTSKCLGYTTGYASPESLSSEYITPAHDMFSVGMILASLVFDLKPEKDDDYKWVCAKIESNEPVPLADPPMLELISQLLKQNPTERLSAKQVLETHVFQANETK